MARQRTEAEQQIADLLRTARTSLHMSVAFLSRLDGTTQHLEVVDTRVPVLVQEKARVAQDTSFCQAILDGKLPAVIDDVKRHPLAMSLPSARKRRSGWGAVPTAMRGIRTRRKRRHTPPVRPRRSAAAPRRCRSARSISIRRRARRRTSRTSIESSAAVWSRAP